MVNFSTYGFDRCDLVIVRESVVAGALVVAVVVVALFRPGVIHRRPDGVRRRVVEASVQLDPEVFLFVVVLLSSLPAGAQVVQPVKPRLDAVELAHRLGQRVQLRQDGVRLTVCPPVHRVHLEHELLDGPVKIFDPPQLGLERREDDLEHAQEVDVAENKKQVKLNKQD